jgi:hypothetical protein|nr:MAG TPA: hypothetical protein [Caudoviricetes sp.]
MAISNLPKLNFSVPFAMTAALPVEYNAYFSTLADAQAAAAKADVPGSTTTVYYYGQKIVVVGNTEAKLYIIQPDKTLKEAGGVPLGDGASITVGEDGKIAIKGVAEATANQQPRIKVVDGVKTIEWYTPDTSMVEGLQQTVAGHTTKIESLEGGLSSTIGVLEQQMSKISTLEGNIGLSQQAITANTTAIGTKANAADVYKKTETFSQTEVNDKIAAAISSVYKPAGSSAFADLPTPAKALLGNVYNVSDKFTTDAKFVEGAGKKYPAGTNVVIVAVDTEYKYDVLAGMVDLSDYATTSTVDTAVNTLQTDITDGTVVAGKAKADEDGNNIKTTYATKTSVTGLEATINSIVNETEDPPTIVVAAYKDGEGNVIKDTYATKADAQNTLKVTITQSGGAYSADKTLAEINAALAAGKYVVAMADGVIYRPSYYSNNNNSGIEFYRYLEPYENGTEDIFVYIQSYFIITSNEVTYHEPKGYDIYTTTGADNKFVAKVEGKGLSTNDFTTDLKTKLTNLPAGAQVNAIDTVDENVFAIDENKNLSLKTQSISGSHLTSDIGNMVQYGGNAITHVVVDGAPLTPASDSANHIRSVTIPDATASKLGLVKSAAEDAVNGVVVDPTTHVMSVKQISTDILAQGSNTLIWNGGNASS